MGVICIRKAHDFWPHSARYIERAVGTASVADCIPDGNVCGRVCVCAWRCAIRYLFANLSNCLLMQWCMLHRYLFFTVVRIRCRRGVRGRDRRHIHGVRWFPVWNGTAVAQHDLCFSCNFVCLSTSMQSVYLLHLVTLSLARFLHVCHFECVSRRILSSMVVAIGPSRSSSTSRMSTQKRRKTYKRTRTTTTTAELSRITFRNDDVWARWTSALCLNLNTIIILQKYRRHRLAPSALNSDFGVSITCSNGEWWATSTFVCAECAGVASTDSTKGARARGICESVCGCAPLLSLVLTRWVDDRRQSVLHKQTLAQAKQISNEYAIFVQSREFHLAK